jgi:ABC-2 type transport system ATP-binding protein
MSTPYLDEAERCGRVALLHDGHLLAVDRPERLQARLEGELLEVSVRDGRPPLDVLRSLPGIADVQSFGDRAHVRIRQRDTALVSAIGDALKRHGSSAVSVRPIAASLEDVFIDLITAGRRTAANSEPSRES